VTQRDAVRACATRAWDEHGPTDVLVNNAGGPLFQAPFLEVREEGWLRVLELNLNSVYRFCQATGGRMVAQGSGAIVNIASALPTRAWPRIAAYSAAKAAVLSLSQSLAVEWGPLGIRVNAVCPGWINTELNRVYTSDPRRVSRILDAVPLAHMAEVDDVVGSVLWLASDAAKYVTGINLPVDGGLAIGISREWLSDMARFTTPIDPSEHDTRTASGPGVSAGAFIDLEDT
jgi:NAD(P)-dependent dehydrogenase (short-subunit alcohol dehydrogenase family)